MNIISAYIEITNACNLNCETCYNRSGSNRERQEISVGQLAGMIRRLRSLGCKTVYLAGGEPCLHSDFDRILDLPGSYPDLKFGIVTNGTIHPSKLICQYRTQPNLTVQVSLDGSCEAQNLKTRGKQNFEKTVRLIKVFCENQEEEKKVRVKMVVSQNNCEDIEAFYEMVLSLGAHPEYAFINRRGNGRDDWESKALNARKKLEILKRIDQLNLKHHLNVTLPFCTSDCPLSDPKTPMAIAVKTDGSIIPCQLLYHPKHTLGNMLCFSKKEVEEGFRRIAGMVTRRKETDYGCSLCLLRNHCKKGCMALADDMTDDPLSGDGDCEYRKIQILGYDIQKQIQL